MVILGYEFPDERYYLLERDMWCARLEDGAFSVGVTSFGVELSGNFFFCRPKPAGLDVAQGDTIAVAELNKSVVTIRTPVSGRIVLGNARLADQPDLIETDPYGEGWIVHIAPSRWDQDLTGLAHGDALHDAMLARMRLENHGRRPDGA